MKKITGKFIGFITRSVMVVFVSPPGALLCKLKVLFSVSLVKLKLGRPFTKTRIPGHRDTMSYIIRHESNALIILVDIVSRPSACKVVHNDNDDNRRDSTGSDSNTDKATF